MSTIPHYPSMGGQASQFKPVSDEQFSSYVRKQSVSAYESLDAGLTIQTKEGDVVTLTSNSYAALDAHMYDSKGILQTESGRAMVTQNIREITLASGESFAFSVAGDLNEDELADIENIVKGIDGIISEVVEGDIDEAVEKALSMGNYGSVSMYAADISYQKYYKMTSEIQAETSTGALNPVQEPEILPREEKLMPSVSELSPENYSFYRPKNNTINNINQLFEKMVKILEKHEENLVEKAQKPIGKLFRHHLEDVKKDINDGNEEKQAIHNTIDKTRKKIDKLIDQMSHKMFKDDFEAFLE